MITGTQAEEVPRTLCFFRPSPHSCRLLSADRGRVFLTHCGCISLLLLRLACALPFLVFHADTVTSFQHISGPASDTQFLSVSFLGLNMFTKCPCFTCSQVSGNTFPSLRTIQSNPRLQQPWARY
ncbi:hypothetical protein HJG60_008653 [Phyllostomus discolor]|uniref:Uncharacterized protein n=1 Tax=Phyllostomus discolor TaxID=89673 RepID=A0A833Z535_9CHIR|nr:hypothetical protein HJG60_008653 [Phyllostomus discolor]